MKSIGVAVLAAGKGTRLKIDCAKALCPSLGLTLIDHVMGSIQKFSVNNQIEANVTAVVGHKKEEVEIHLKAHYSNVSFAWQKVQNGTGDALKSYFSECPPNEKFDYTFAVCADTPLITSSIFEKLWSVISSDVNTIAVAATFELSDPTGYGRILREKKGFSIVEEKDASLDQKKIQEVNSGFYLVQTAYLIKMLKGLNNKNKSGEFYLTDIFQPEANVQAIKFKDPTDFLGVNTLVQLEEVTQVLKKRKLSELMLSGVMCLNADSIWIEQEVIVGPETIIYPSVHLSGKTVIGKNVIIENGAIIKDSVIEDGAHIFAYSHIEKSHVRRNAQVGPFARLRPEADIGEKAKIGNFVEIKKSTLHKGAKVSHLSYVGDAEIGEESNIGCGFITCNYDGQNKHKTKIGSHTFIGSDVQVVAPIEIGDSAFVAAGSTITKSVPKGGFAIARSAQATKDGLAHRFLKPKK